MVLIVGLLLHAQSFNDWVEDATNWAEGVINEYPVAGAVVFFALSAASAMLAFASSAILVPPATEVWGQPVTFLLLWGGWTAGAITAYGIGRLARPLVIRMGYKHKLEEYERLVSKHMILGRAALLHCRAFRGSWLSLWRNALFAAEIPRCDRHRRSDLRSRLDCRGRKHLKCRAASSDSHCRNACGRRNRRGLVAS